MKIKVLISIVVIGLNISGLFAQVTIGSPNEPMGGALLDLKQEDSSSKNSDLGLKIPRVALSDMYELYPMYGSATNEDAVYTSNKDQLKKSNKGLMVYNMSKESGMIRGMYIWDGEKWMNFKTKNLADPVISRLLCDASYMEPAYYTAGVPFNGLLKVPYLGGNGAFHSETDVKTGNGLTFTLQPGQLEDGAGVLVYKVTGTPLESSPKTTSIAVAFLGHTCDNVTVGYSPEKELRYHRKIVTLNTETTAKSELYVGNLTIRYNYDVNRNGADYIEFKLDMPAHLSYHFDKNKGYGTYGQYDAAADTWYNFMSGTNVSYQKDNMPTDGNLNPTKRDIATAHIVIQRDDNRDVYRLTTISHGDIARDGDFTAVPSAVILYLERLETQINI